MAARMSMASPFSWIARLVLVGLAWFIVACGGENDAPRDPTSDDVCRSAPVEGYGFDRYGGWKGISLAPARRFRVEQVNETWWLITPEGHVLFSNGPTGIDPVGDYIRGTNQSHYLDAVLAKYGSREAWADGTIARLCDLGIRTHGGWLSVEDSAYFSGRLPYSLNTSFYSLMPEVAGAPASVRTRRDVFVDDAAERARVAASDAAGVVRHCAADPWCIGVYVENELAWAPTLLAAGGHLDVYLAAPAGAPGKQAVQTFFEQRYSGDIGAFNAVWGTSLGAFADIQSLTKLGSCPLVIGFADDLCQLREGRARYEDRMAFEAKVASRISQVAEDALTQIDPGMLNLGPRITTEPLHPAVVRALAAPVDVLSINNYDISAFAHTILPPAVEALLSEYDMLPIDPFDRLRKVYEVSGKPVLISEWFFRVARPDVPAYPPFLPEVPTAADQAAAYRAYMDEILAMPFVVGEHWFQWVDQPVEGRGDGENQLIGLVSVADELNQPLADTVRATNAEILGRRR